MIPFALEAAVCVLSNKVPGVALPGVSTPALGLPYPSLDKVAPIGKTLVVWGGSSSTGALTIQLATAAGINVIATSGAHNFELVKKAGASEVFDHKDAAIVDKIVAAAKRAGGEFVGIFDAIGTPETYTNDLSILEKLDGGHLALTHPPLGPFPDNVKAGMIFAVNDVAAPVWKDYVTPALQSGKLQILPPPTILGKGLEYLNEGLKKSKAGVSGTKLVVEI